MTMTARLGLLLFLTVQGFGAPVAALEAEMRAAGLVDVQGLDPSIRVDLKYSTTDNFMHAAVYGDLVHCYLQREVAELLVKAQGLLKQRRPELSLKVFDGARPRRVQELMWAIVKGTEQQKYVASPASGSMHNFGSAVDLTLTDRHGVDLDMGTPYDFLGELAQPRYQERFLQEGRLTRDQVEHRELLRAVMVGAGFSPIPNEWWHFDAFSRSEVKVRYRILE
jgi:D-alanyl-D-alanine dipeptidase